MKSNLLTIVMIFSFCAVAQSENKGEIQIKILFTNNSNGKIVNCNCRNDPYGGLAERVDFIRKYRQSNPDFLFFDSGGYFGISKQNENNLAVKLMEMMDYDAIGVSEQEFYFGQDKFFDSIDKIKGKIINANLMREHNPLLTPYKIFDKEGIKIGVIGLVSPDAFKYLPKETNYPLIANPDSVLADILPELKKSCDYIIILSQMGVDKDKYISNKFKQIDLIIGGHSQTLIEKAEKINQSYVVQAGKNGGRVGEIILSFNKGKKISDISYRLNKITDNYQIPEDIKPLLNLR